MSSSLTLIQAISPALIGLSFAIPFLYGWGNKKWYTALSLGWCLFILSSCVRLFTDRYQQIESVSNNTIYLIEPSQPNLTVAICLGWIPSLVGYFLGKKLREIRESNKS